MTDPLIAAGSELDYRYPGAMRWSPETAEPEPRPWDDLKSSGLLWLINRVVFHPRGWALGLVRKDGLVVGWRLLGNGREVWQFDGDEDELFAAAVATLTPPEESS